MTRRRFPVPRARRNRRSVADVVQRREMADWWAWTWVCARQMARLPAGRLVTEYRGFEAGVSVLLGGGDDATND